MLLVK